MLPSVVGGPQRDLMALGVNAPIIDVRGTVETAAWVWSGVGVPAQRSSASGQQHCQTNDNQRDPIHWNPHRSGVHHRRRRRLTPYRRPVPALSPRHHHARRSHAREETRESRGMPCLFLNTERGFGGKPPKNRGFVGILRGQKCPKRGQKCLKRRFFPAISRWRVASRRALDASGF